MKSTVRIILALFVLSVVAVGLVPASPVEEHVEHVRVPALQNGLTSDSLFASFNYDGVAAYGPQRRKRRKRARRRRAQAIPIIPPSKEIPMVSPAPPPPPPEPMEAPVQMEAPTEAAPPVRSSPNSGIEGGGARPKSAPRIKPPSVQIKPPTR